MMKKEKTREEKRREENGHAVSMVIAGLKRYASPEKSSEDVQVFALRF